MRQAEEAPRLIGDVLEIDEATAFADHVEQVAVLRRGGIDYKWLAPLQVLDNRTLGACYITVQ